MLAKSAVPQGALLFSIPEALLLTANSGVRSPLCGQLIKQHELGEWQALVLHLLCERAAGPDSFWVPYLAVLGDQRHHPLLWPPHVQAQLAGSSMRVTLQARLEQVQQDTELLVAAGANELPIAAAWQQQTQVRAGGPRSNQAGQCVHVPLSAAGSKQQRRLMGLGLTQADPSYLPWRAHLLRRRRSWMWALCPGRPPCCWAARSAST